MKTVPPQWITYYFTWGYYLKMQQRKTYNMHSEHALWLNERIFAGSKWIFSCNLSANMEWIQTLKEKHDRMSCSSWMCKMCDFNSAQLILCFISLSGKRCWMLLKGAFVFTGMYFPHANNCMDFTTAPVGPLSLPPPPFPTSYEAEMTHQWLQTTVSMADWQKWGSASFPARPRTTQTDSQWRPSEWRPVTHRKAIHHQAIYKWSSPTITFNGHEYERAECTFAQQHTYMHTRKHTRARA